MNKSYFNGKYNLILCADFKYDKLPKNIVVRSGRLEDVALTIRKEEIENDEVFCGNIIVNSDYGEIDFDNIFKLKLDDNWLYTNDFEHTPYSLSAPPGENICWCKDDLLYCSSFVLWILGNRHRTKNTLYGLCRAHRIGLKLIDTLYYNEVDLIKKWDLSVEDLK